MLCGIILISASSLGFALGEARAQSDHDALIKARSHFFGFENVDQRTGAVDREKVIISWFSVQSFAVAAKRAGIPARFVHLSDFR
jgi:hypothetical protein